MLIREVERQTGIKDVNIRYYEKEGLIHPERKSNGYREYSEADVERILQIKVLRLLEIPVPMIRQVLEGEISLQEVMEKRLEELNDEEQKIKEIRNSCENILSENISISNLNEDLLYGNKSTWKARLDEIMKEDIDKKFIGGSVLYIIGWAIFAKLSMAVIFAEWAPGSLGLAFNLEVSGPGYYALSAVGMFLILYGFGLTVFEALTGKGFLWVWGRNWSGGGLGGLANSFTFIGIGVGILGMKMPLFLALLIITSLISVAIRGYLMYRNKRVSQNQEVRKPGKIVFVISIILLVIFLAYLGILYQQAKSDPSMQGNTKEQVLIDTDKVEQIDITTENWEDYFEQKEEMVYGKDASGQITSVFLDSWFELKEEYYDRISEEVDSYVNFYVRYKTKNKEYKITDTKNGAYEIVGDAPSNDTFGGVGKPTGQVISWAKVYDEGLESERENYAPLYLEHSKQNPYMEVYEDFKLETVKGTLYLNK